MQFIQKLKTKSILSAVLLALVFLLCAVMFLAGSQFWLFLQEPAYLYDVPREDLEGAYVTVELPRIFGSYACTEEFENDFDTVGTLVSQEYIIDANDYDYCGLLVKDDDMIDQANALMESTFAYLDYEAEEITGTFTVTGVMKEMPSDSLEFYHEIVGYESLSIEEQEAFLPLYLDVRDGDDTFGTVMLAVFGAVFLAVALFLVIRACIGANQKQILDKAMQLSPAAPEMILDQLDQMHDANPKAKILMNGRFIFANNGNASRLYAMEELVWAYHAVTTQRVYFIPVGKTHSLALAMLDGKIIQVPMKEDQVKEQLQAIQAQHPSCFLGFSKDLEAMYRKNPASLLQLRASQTQQ